MANPIVDGELREMPVLVGWIACPKCDTWYNPKKYPEKCPTCGRINK